MHRILLNFQTFQTFFFIHETEVCATNQEENRTQHLFNSLNNCILPSSQNVEQHEDCGRVLRAASHGRVHLTHPVEWLKQNNFIDTLLPATCEQRILTTTNFSRLLKHIGTRARIHRPLNWTARACVSSPPLPMLGGSRISPRRPIVSWRTRCAFYSKKNICCRYPRHH